MGASDFSFSPPNDNFDLALKTNKLLHNLNQSFFYKWTCLQGIKLSSMMGVYN